MSKQSKVAPPGLSKPGIGGLYPKGGPKTYDSLSEEYQRVAQGIEAITRDFISCRALKPHLIKWGLRLKDNGDGLAFRCIACDGKQKAHCACSQLVKKRRREGFMVAIWKDPEIRPLFDKHGLAVQVR